MKGKNKMEYVIKHKKNKKYKGYNIYLKRYGNLNLNHYVFKIEEATKFDRRNGKAMLGKFRHPENWELEEVIGSDKRKKKWKRQKLSRLGSMS